jgi:hypothetical protein
MEKALMQYDIQLMRTTIGNRNIFENSSSGLSVLEIGAKTVSDREGQREMRDFTDEIEELLGIGNQTQKPTKALANNERTSM